MTEGYRAPVDNREDKLVACWEHFEPIVRSAHQTSNRDLLGRLGACFNPENKSYDLAVNPLTGETGAQVVGITASIPLVAHTFNTLKGFNPDITVAQAITFLVKLPHSDSLEEFLPPEIISLEPISIYVG